jgi:hypothetical protein
LKKQAAANKAALRQLQIGSLLAHGIFLVFRLLLQRASITQGLLVVYALVTIGSVFLQWQLESMGRPKYDPATRTLVRSGLDLHQTGVTEYMFDMIYITWFVLLLSVVTDLAWFVYLVIPVYAVYKAVSLYTSMKA